MSTIEQANKTLILEYYQALEQANFETIGDVLSHYMSDDCQWYGVHPFNVNMVLMLLTKCFGNRSYHHLSQFSADKMSLWRAIAMVKIGSLVWGILWCSLIKTGLESLVLGVLR